MTRLVARALQKAASIGKSDRRNEEKRVNYALPECDPIRKIVDVDEGLQQMDRRYADQRHRQLDSGQSGCASTLNRATKVS